MSVGPWILGVPQTRSFLAIRASKFLAGQQVTNRRDAPFRRLSNSPDCALGWPGKVPHECPCRRVRGVHPAPTQYLLATVFTLSKDLHTPTRPNYSPTAPARGHVHVALSVPHGHLRVRTQRTLASHARRRVPHRVPGRGDD